MLGDRRRSAETGQIQPGDVDPVQIGDDPHELHERVALLARRVTEARPAGEHFQQHCGAVRGHAENTRYRNAGSGQRPVYGCLLGDIDLGAGERSAGLFPEHRCGLVAVTRGDADEVAVPGAAPGSTGTCGQGPTECRFDPCDERALEKPPLIATGHDARGVPSSRK